MIFTVTIVAFQTVTIFLLWEWWKFTFGSKGVPSAPNWPWIGSFLYMKEGADKWPKLLNSMAKRFNYLFTLWVGPNPLVVSANLEFHAAVLKDPKLIDKPSYYRLMEQVIGRNIGTSDGSTYWHRMRRNLTPAFHVKMLKHYGKVFEKHAIALSEQFTELCNKNNTFDVQPISRETAMRIIMETTMGIDLQDVDITVLKLQMDSLKTLEQITVYRAKRPWLYPEWIFFKTAKGKIVKEQHAFIEQFATKIIQERKKVREETEEDNSKAIIDILLDVHKRGEMEMKDMLGEITVFIGAGHDTSATAISWTLFLLAKYPEVQERLFEDIKERDPTNIEGDMFEKYGNIEYLELVIKESLRLRAPIPLIVRQVREEKLIAGVKVPKGTDLGIGIDLLHHNPEYWPHPDVFDPERFLKQQQPFTYIPFSAGLRNCIGQKFALWEMRVALCHVVSKFKITTVQKNVVTEWNPEQHSENGLWISLEHR